MSLLQPNVFLTRKDAARLLQECGLPVRESTLERLRPETGGPVCCRINGRWLYRREWLEDWVKQQVSQSMPMKQTKNI